MKSALFMLALVGCAPSYRMAARHSAHPCPPQMLVTLDAIGVVSLAAGAALAFAAHNQVRAGLELGASVGIAFGGAAAEVTCK